MSKYFRHLLYFVRLRICLFVCLFVCYSIFSKTISFIFMKLYDMIGYGLGRKPIKFHESRSKVKVTKNSQSFKKVLSFNMGTNFKNSYWCHFKPDCFNILWDDTQSEHLTSHQVLFGFVNNCDVTNFFNFVWEIAFKNLKKFYKIEFLLFHDKTYRPDGE